MTMRGNKYTEECATQLSSWTSFVWDSLFFCGFIRFLNEKKEHDGWSMTTSYPFPVDLFKSGHTMRRIDNFPSKLYLSLATVNPFKFFSFKQKIWDRKDKNVTMLMKLLLSQPFYVIFSLISAPLHSYSCCINFLVKWLS